jgi:hypothetical protein
VFKMTEKTAKVQGGSDNEKRRRLRRGLFIATALVFAVGGVAVQFVPVKGIGVNPSGENYVIKAPAEVRAILERSCFDCHTNQTAWPWYARIAPGSWLIARDVKKGRSRMNMSEWSDDDIEAMVVDKENSWDQIEEGHMPPWFYLPMHPTAYLSDKEKALLKGWFLAHKQPAGQAAAAAAAVKPVPQ